MSDLASLSSAVDTAADPATPPAKASRASRKKVPAKTKKKPSARKGGGGAGATAQVKVGSRTLTVPKDLAASLTPKDLKKMRAIFKRARRRAKKRSAKKSA